QPLDLAQTFGDVVHRDLGKEGDGQRAVGRLSDTESADHPDQDGRADERYHDATHEARLAVGSEGIHHDAADERPDNAEDDVAEDAVAATARYLAGEPTRN